MCFDLGYGLNFGHLNLLNLLIAYLYLFIIYRFTFDQMKIHVVSSGNMTLEEVRGISVVFNGFKPLDHHIASGFGLISIRDFVEKKENALIISDCNSCVKVKQIF